MKRADILFLCTLLLGVSHAEGVLTVNALFSDHMVLQRNRPVPVWGTDEPGAVVRVEFAGQTSEGIAGGEGLWRVELIPMKESTSPQALKVTSSLQSEPVVFSDILIGDVWLCGGQSNMATLMKDYLIWNEVEQGFSNDQVRLFKLKQGGVESEEPGRKIVIDPFFNNSWQACSPRFAAEFSATAGFFGMKLQGETGVPIGLLYANRGNTQINSWLPREVLEGNPEYARFLDPSNPSWTASPTNPDAIQAPSCLFNGTIHPLSPFAIRGAIWYQGESDSQWPDLYYALMQDLVRSWRELWGYEFPFLYVQIAPWSGPAKDISGESWAWLRDAQTRALAVIPNSGMVVISDAGEKEDIHPQAKNIPGERLAVLAASLDDPTVQADIPVLIGKTIKGNQVLLRFGKVSGGLQTLRVAMNQQRGFLPGTAPDAVIVERDTLAGFTLCGPDGNFVPAQAEITSADTVSVSAEGITNPVAVRYGWSNFPLGNLYGGNDMPAVSFRTDDFDRPSFNGSVAGQPYRTEKKASESVMPPFNAADGGFQVVEIDCLKAYVATGNYLYFRAKEAFPTPHAVRVRVIYHDTGYQNIALQYDSSDDQVFAGTRPGAWKRGGSIACTNSGQWREVSIELPDARFQRRCNGADIRLTAPGVAIYQVFLETAPSS